MSLGTALLAYWLAGNILIALLLFELGGAALLRAAHTSMRESRFAHSTESILLCSIALMVLFWPLVLALFLVVRIRQFLKEARRAHDR